MIDVGICHTQRVACKVHPVVPQQERCTPIITSWLDPACRTERTSVSTVPNFFLARESCCCRATSGTACAPSPAARQKHAPGPFADRVERGARGSGGSRRLFRCRGRFLRPTEETPCSRQCGRCFENTWLWRIGIQAAVFLCHPVVFINKHHVRPADAVSPPQPQLWRAGTRQGERRCASVQDASPLGAGKVGAKHGRSPTRGQDAWHARQDAWGAGAEDAWGAGTEDTWGAGDEEH